MSHTVFCSSSNVRVSNNISAASDVGKTAIYVRVG